MDNRSQGNSLVYALAGLLLLAGIGGATGYVANKYNPAGSYVATTGSNGTNGTNGVNGTNGSNLPNGTNGINGTNSVNGANGVKSNGTTNPFVSFFSSGAALVPQDSGSNNTGSNGVGGVHIASQQQGTFSFPSVVPTVTKQLIDCSYGPGELSCIASNPRTCADWNESTVLPYFSPPTTDSKLRAWYTDEHALPLGAGAVSPMTQHPADHIVNPNPGDLTAVDTYGRPYGPNLYITDLTSNPASRTGDWENGGTGYPPDEVFGSWKAANTNSDPQANNTNLGPGADPVPQGIDYQEYVSEIIWDLSNPKYNLLAGHSYRLEFMLHDGDRDADSGEKCASIVR